MKKLILFLIMVLMSHLQLKADSIGIKLQLSDGTSQLLLLEDEPIAKFRGDTLVVTSKKQEVLVALGENSVVSVTYIDEATHIEEIKKESHPIFRINESGFEVSGLEPKSYIYVYDLKGYLLDKSVAHDDGTARVSLAGKGIFIVKTSVSTFKIKK